VTLASRAFLPLSQTMSLSSMFLFPSDYHTVARDPSRVNLKTALEEPILSTFLRREPCGQAQKTSSLLLFFVSMRDVKYIVTMDISHEVRSTALSDRHRTGSVWYNGRSEVTLHLTITGRPKADPPGNCNGRI
jgi:hypothetical protein